MNKLSAKFLKKRTQKVYRYGHAAGHGQAPSTFETDPTNTTITVLTTVSGSTHFHLPGSLQKNR
ncbi:hypothetical protein [Mucilaginibacter pedocola]|uniref:hypothetical protein n=1 Tax=Mucilaginibacter pedocola TaxID=1792845 RepID=UPI00117F477F|nr:hypothetical protein [Mucilaginibacter pedocola]